MDGFTDRKPGCHNVFDDHDAGALLDLEPAQLEVTTLPFHPDRRHLKVTRRLVGGDDTTDRGADHIVNSAKAGGADLVGKATANTFSHVCMHEHARLLQKHRT